jgi:hypothetical protein
VEQCEFKFDRHSDDPYFSGSNMLFDTSFVKPASRNSICENPKKRVNFMNSSDGIILLWVRQDIFGLVL